MAGDHLKRTIFHQQTFTARHITTSCHVTPDQVTSHHVKKDNNQVQQGKKRCVCVLSVLLAIQLRQRPACCLTYRYTDLPLVVRQQTAARSLNSNRRVISWVSSPLPASASWEGNHKYFRALHPIGWRRERQLALSYQW